MAGQTDEQTTLHLFYGSDIVFRIVIVHAANLETAIDTASVMVALGKHSACERYGDTTNLRKCLKACKTVNSF